MPPVRRRAGAAGKKSSSKGKDYVEIARQHITRPSLQKTWRRILCYGRNKKGKSTFALSAGIPQTLELDCEHGTDTMVKNDPYVWHVSKWEELQDVISAIRTGELSPKVLGLGPEEEPFSWLAPDTLTRFNNLALRYIMRLAEESNLDRRPGLVDRRDYFKSGELMKELLMQLHSLPINICYTAQEKMKAISSGGEDEEEEGTEYMMVPDLPDAVRGAANSWVEVIGRIYVVRIDQGDKKVAQRRLHIGVSDIYDTGYRSDFVLPDMIRNPTLPKLVKLMAEGPPPPRKKTGTRKIAAS